MTLKNVKIELKKVTWYFNKGTMKQYFALFTAPKKHNQCASNKILSLTYLELSRIFEYDIFILHFNFFFHKSKLQKSPIR